MTRLEDLTEQEIARRLPVWVALADLFLDCPQGESGFRWSARTIYEAGYTLPEARAILFYEVAPAFFRNRSVYPGERWTVWLDDEVREMVLTRLAKFRLWERIPLWRDLLYWFQSSRVEDDWTRVALHFKAMASA